LNKGKHLSEVVDLNKADAETCYDVLIEADLEVPEEYVDVGQMKL